MKVLIVDDEPALRESLARSLRFEGYDVSTAVDGAEALQAVPEVRPHLLLVDVMMPRMDGVQLCRALRAGGDRTPILMVTARDAVRDRVRGLDAGADDYIVKPFAYEELLARVRALVRRTRTEGSDGDRLVVGDLSLDAATWWASRRSTVDLPYPTAGATLRSRRSGCGHGCAENGRSTMAAVPDLAADRRARPRRRRGRLGLVDRAALLPHHLG
ncbi:response regulator transcription factor [Agromyces silvae]|uniref:response regulator transcription factor n=1 Tax=Agromyces silvae TaxID=3388266 RepID=UPI00280C34EC|nr:response regulator [Agromyces protaetiae]